MDVIEKLLVSDDLIAAGLLTEGENLTDEELAIRRTTYVGALITRNTPENEPYDQTECCICFENTEAKWKANEYSNTSQICETCWVIIVFTAFNNNSIVQYPLCRSQVDTLECVE